MNMNESEYFFFDWFWRYFLLNKMYNSKLHNNVLFQHIRSNCVSRKRGVKNEIQKKRYTDTILLPRTDFPARLAGQKRVDMDNYIYQVIFRILNFISLINWNFIIRTVVSKNFILGKEITSLGLSMFYTMGHLMPMVLHIWGMWSIKSWKTLRWGIKSLEVKKYIMYLGGIVMAYRSNLEH